MHESGNTSSTPLLIVEDSVTQTLTLQNLLEKNGYHVVTATEGRQALEILKEYRPALIISDIMMPVMDGYEMCAVLKQDPELGEIPVILLTYLADAEDVLRGLSAQADYYLTKPYDAPYLLSRINALLQAPLPREDPEGRLEVTMNGKLHVVTSSRLQMLNLLLSTYENAVQQNRVLVKTQQELEATNQQLREQKQKLERSRANYRALLEDNADAMIVVDRQGSLRFLNPAARALFSREDEQFLRDLLAHSTVAGQTIEVEIQRSAGEPITAELRIVETEWEDEQATLATLRDVTPRKRYEEQIAQLQAQLA